MDKKEYFLLQYGEFGEVFVSDLELAQVLAWITFETGQKNFMVSREGLTTWSIKKIN